jgi:hypothetical protein
VLGRLERERGVKGRRLRSNSKERGAMRTITVLEGTSPERERNRGGVDAEELTFGAIE